MSFYEEIHSYYEDIFPAGSSQMAFLQKVLAKGQASAVLDAACGTGAYARALAEAGFKVTGIDFEEAMIREAKKKTAEQIFPHTPQFLKGDMRNLSSFSAAFDAVLCLGNSLPHLLTDEDIHAFFRGSREALGQPQGLLLVQTVNYDRVLKNGAYELPVIINAEKKLRFTRLYTPRRDGLLNFHTKLIIEGRGYPLKRENSVPLRPLLKEELSLFLRQNGFEHVNFYGSFAGDPWEQDSKATVLVATASSAA